MAWRLESKAVHPVSPRKPNLFIVGAMKSGTTYLHHLLAQHPAIFMSPTKEPNYFVDRRPLNTTKGRLHADYGSGERLEAYLALFREARDEVYLGESSTAYTKTPKFTDVTPRIEAFAEDPRFIYLMRDPVERAISQYWHAVANSGERRPLLEAIRETKGYRNVSSYARQLKPYLTRFGRGRVHATTFEEFTADPVAVLGQLWRWLEVDDAFVPPELEAKKHARPEIVYRNTPLFDVKKLLRLNNRTLKSEMLRSAIKRLNKGGTILKEQVKRSEEDSEAAKDYLRPIMLKQVKKLEELLGRDFPQWTTLHGALGDGAPAAPAGAVSEL